MRRRHLAQQRYIAHRRRDGGAVSKVLSSRIINADICQRSTIVGALALEGSHPAQLWVDAHYRQRMVPLFSGHPTPRVEASEFLENLSTPCLTTIM
jgi:hypothetical protein